MIIDTSAIVAIIRREPEAEAFIDAILDHSLRFMSTASYVETAEVLARRFGQDDAAEQLDRAIRVFGIELVDVTVEQARMAVAGRALYGRGRGRGRGRGHPANLNFGDCFVYAIAMVLNRPLLFKGNDFIHTDVARVI